jgi:hypothetical protein
LEEAEEGTEAVSPLSGVYNISGESTGRGCGGSVRRLAPYAYSTSYTCSIDTMGDWYERCTEDSDDMIPRSLGSKPPYDPFSASYQADLAYFFGLGVDVDPGPLEGVTDAVEG